MEISIKLPVLFHTEESLQYELLNNNDAPMELLIIKNVYLFEISNIHQYENTNKTNVVSGSTNYLVNIEFNKLVTIIKQNRLNMRYCN